MDPVENQEIKAADKQEKPQNNRDLLLCENPYFLEKSKLSTKLNFNNKDNDDDKKGKTLKTERVTSSVLSQVKGFLELVKTNDPKCVNIEQNDENDDNDNMESESKDSELVDCDNDTEDGPSNVKQDIELNLLLFKQNDNNLENENSEDSSDSDDNDGDK